MNASDCDTVCWLQMTLGGGEEVVCSLLSLLAQLSHRRNMSWPDK